MMSVAILVLPPKSKKAHLLDLVTRIVEGNDIRYITGSGETAATRRRVAIYEIEGNITPLPRPPRRNYNSDEMPRVNSFGSQHSLYSSDADVDEERERETLGASLASKTIPSTMPVHNTMHLDLKRTRADSEVNFNEAASVLLLLNSQSRPRTRSRSNSLVSSIST